MTNGKQPNLRIPGPVPLPDDVLELVGSVVHGDFSWADLILGMQGRHAVEIARRWPQARARTRLLGDFLASPPYGIHDPWGETEDVLARTLDQIAAAVDRFATLLEEQQR